jgi:Tol biopolymer transport system component
MITIDQRDAMRLDFDAPSAAIAADGRYIAFTTYLRYSRADTDDRSDVYVFDRALTRITFESDGDDPAHSRSDASSPALSGDGGTLVYELDGRLIARDRATGIQAAIGTGRQPSVSHDGTLVAFTSRGVDQPVTQASAEQEHVRIYNRRDGSIRSITGTTIVRELRARATISPSISADGRRVAFTAILGRRSAANDAEVLIWDSRSAETRRVAEGWDPTADTSRMSPRAASVPGPTCTSSRSTPVMSN